MKPRRLTVEEERRLKQKPFAINKYVMMRNLNRLGFRKVEDVVMNGEIWQEGKVKFRSVIPIERGKIAYVIFEDHAEFLKFKTCGVVTRKKVFG